MMFGRPLLEVHTFAKVSSFYFYLRVFNHSYRGMALGSYNNYNHASYNNFCTVSSEKYLGEFFWTTKLYWKKLKTSFWWPLGSNFESRRLLRVRSLERQIWIPEISNIYTYIFVFQKIFFLNIFLKSLCLFIKPFYYTSRNGNIN